LTICGMVKKVGRVDFATRRVGSSEIERYGWSVRNNSSQLARAWTEAVRQCIKEASQSNERPASEIPAE